MFFKILFRWFVNDIIERLNEMLLRYLAGVLLVFCVVASQVLASEEVTVVYYEPHSTTLSGKVLIVESLHPNGTLMHYPILYLGTAIIVAVDLSNKINIQEENVREIQIYSSDTKLYLTQTTK